MSRSETIGQDLGNKTIGDYVAEDNKTAKVFEKYGIDFCCGGKGSSRQYALKKVSILPR